MLRATGFSTTLLSARVNDRQGRFGPEFDHLLLLVQIDDSQWLADVGFGDAFEKPLPLQMDIPQQQGKDIFRLEKQNSGNVLLTKSTRGADVEPLYLFTLQPRQLVDFSAMCHYQQTAPESFFRKGRICSKLTPAGRITLTANCFRFWKNGKKQKKAIEAEQAFNYHLQRYFGIE